MTQNRFGSETAAGCGGVWLLLRGSTEMPLLKPQRRAAPCLPRETTLTRYLRDGIAGGADSDLRRAHSKCTTLLCGTASDFSRIRRRLPTHKGSASNPQTLRQNPLTRTPFVSSQRVPAVRNLLFAVGSFLTDVGDRYPLHSHSVSSPRAGYGGTPD